VEEENYLRTGQHAGKPLPTDELLAMQRISRLPRKHIPRANEPLAMQRINRFPEKNTRERLSRYKPLAETKTHTRERLSR